MILTPTLLSDININRLEDLFKLKPLMNHANLKVNKAAIARDLKCDPRTVSKYIDGYQKPTKRKRYSPIDEFYPLIKELLESSTQVFFYKRVLWQYLTDNHKIGRASCRERVSSPV